MSTIVAPVKPGFAPPRGSPLNPQALPRSTPMPRSLRTDPRTHLSNLDRLLLKKSPPPPPPEPRQDRRPAKEPVGNENEEHGYGEPGGGIFHALNLNTIIPSLRKASTEAMSPRSLAQLQRLLSSPRLSPKNPIASRWRLLHGASDWDGLLDPLDENLRRELTRYGDLVQAAYHAFHSNPAAAPHHRRDVILPDRSYRVTKPLYATSSVDLPRWVAGAVAPWMTQRSSWFGYVAVCDNEREIARMGRRDIVIALRGTATCLEWAENFRAGLVPLESSGEEEDDSKVANGFLSLYKTSRPGVPSLSAMVVEEVRRLTELYKGEELSITITGHSLGGAIALLVADELTTRLPQAPPIAVFSFGGPKVGNRAFADRLDKKGVKALRVVNSNDVVPRVPGVLPREELGRRIGRPMDGYAHFGAELRVDSRSSPYLKPDADPNCCHDLESYLHLVDGFVDRDCPFRSDAKRSLVRLFELQRPNLKKLCVTQARAMGLDRLEAPAALASPSQVGYLASPSA
ncbi:putative phospholipase A1-Ibeta2, chloroplastic [Iris pallida]|uniref:Phospholipase A1-Ibeta2, chloroplastic n=1 Tax=Iris pallida TaxID=29817 RepID=A0AAX6E4X8_IRIPA|nr:putative phospholipase A1-Ibeta2, chloroplastic [Iris pallida]KAJ6840927.1 putative phospholipase A1-Ibeta2, chloroplastic [Iris pallida]